MIFDRTACTAFLSAASSLWKTRGKTAPWRVEQRNVAAMDADLGRAMGDQDEKGGDRAKRLQVGQADGGAGHPRRRARG